MIRRPRRSPLFPYPTLFRSYDFEQGIEGRPRQPHDTRAEVARDRRCLVTHRVLGRGCKGAAGIPVCDQDRKSTRLNSSHLVISYAVFCLKKKNKLTTADG